MRRTPPLPAPLLQNGHAALGAQDFQAEAGQGVGLQHEDRQLPPPASPAGAARLARYPQGSPVVRSTRRPGPASAAKALAEGLGLALRPAASATASRSPAFGCTAGAAPARPAAARAASAAARRRCRHPGRPPPAGSASGQVGGRGGPGLLRQETNLGEAGGQGFRVQGQQRAEKHPCGPERAHQPLRLGGGLRLRSSTSVRTRESAAQRTLQGGLRPALRPPAAPRSRDPGAGGATARRGRMPARRTEAGQPACACVNADKATTRQCPVKGPSRPGAPPPSNRLY